MLDLLNVSSSVGVYRLVGREDESRHWLCSGLSRRNQLTVGDPPWVDLESLPAFADYPFVNRRSKAVLWNSSTSSLKMPCLSLNKTKATVM